MDDITNMVLQKSNIPTVDDLAQIAKQPNHPKTNSIHADYLRTKHTTEHVAKVLVGKIGAKMRSKPLEKEWKIFANFSGWNDKTQLGLLHVVDLAFLIQEELHSEYHFTLHQPKHGFDDGEWSIQCDVFII